MGVKIPITQEDLPKDFQKYKLTKSIDGISQTVYFLDNLYVIKIFATKELKSLHNEIDILNLLKNLNVPQPLNKIFYIKNYPALIYSKAKGQSLQNTTYDSIRQIAKFLSQLHQITKNKINTNIKRYEKDRLYKLIIKTKQQKFLEVYNNINLTLNHDGIIHGDLFPDNCTFCNGILESVYDFNEACVGDFLFDLAVIAISWCKNDKEIDILLSSYNYFGTITNFKQYYNYAILYYCTTRFLNHIDYKELYLLLKL